MEKEQTTPNNDFDLARGYKDYDSKVKNLEGIFKKLEGILDVPTYQEKFEKIKQEVDENPDIDNQHLAKMSFDSMQLEYESMVLNPYIKRLEDLTKDLEEDILPFYELHLLSSKINLQVNEVTGDNIGKIIEDTKTLIDALNSLNTHNKEDKNHIIEKAYQTIYSVILNEELFDRSDILNYINELNIPVNKENIGRLLSDNLQQIDLENLIDEDLKALKTEKLGNDFLTEDIVRKISRKTVGDHNSEYQERKRQAIEEVSRSAKDLTVEKDSLVATLKKNHKGINNIRFRKGLFTTQILSIVLIPVVAFSIGRGIGKNASKGITEYQSTTRTVEYGTDKIIGNIDYTFEEEKTAYAATILSCSPWRKNPAGVGYIRNVTTYEYVAKEETNGEYQLTKEDLTENVLPKYHYVETKEELEEGDSTEKDSILITETYQDGTTRQSKKYVLPGTLIGVGVGVVIDFLLFYFGIYDLERIRKNLEKLSSEAKEYKLSNQEIKNRLKEMKKEAEQVKGQYNEVVKKYGTWADEFLIDDIDTSWITGKKKRK